MAENKLAQVFHFDLYGKREAKYNFLNENSLDSIDWNELELKEPNFFLVKKNFDESGIYETGFKIDDIFLQNNAGMATEFDDLVIKNSFKDCEVFLQELKTMSAKEILHKYKFDQKKINKIENAINDVNKNNAIITSIDYRPFDSKYTIYTGVSNGIMGRPRNAIMKHLLKPNISLLTCRQQSTFDFQHAFISNKISERCSVSLQTSEVNYVFPLYLYPEAGEQTEMFATTSRTPNLNAEIVKQIADKLSLEFTSEKDSPLTIHNSQLSFAPIDILDYIYAVLHSPTYREKYKEFLKIDFPRVPYPKDAETFWKFVALGGEIRQIHLLESAKVEQYITQYPIDGDNVVGKVRFEPLRPVDTSPCEGEELKGKVWINETQYFDNVPETAWQFYIGGYQPAQKWLKDRKERTLNFEDIFHYQKIIVALNETDRLMKEIDNIEIE